MMSVGGDDPVLVGGTRRDSPEAIATDVLDAGLVACAHRHCGRVLEWSGGVFREVGGFVPGSQGGKHDYPCCITFPTPAHSCANPYEVEDQEHGTGSFRGASLSTCVTRRLRPPEIGSRAGALYDDRSKTYSMTISPSRRLAHGPRCRQCSGRARSPPRASFRSRG